MTGYERAVEWLYTLEAAKGMDFKLERVALALQRLGNPHQCFPSLHVAGTNGKGSVAAMLHAMLGAAGYRAGLYTSPHLVRFTERIRVGTDEVSPDQVAELTAEIQRAVTGYGIELTFFEFVTVMAFLHFARSGIDAAVIEVGLGGRLDATNVVNPVVAIITTIGLDHTEFLGDTVAEVAAEKGGIIKPGRPVVVGNVGSEAAAVLHQIARERGAPLAQAARDFRVSGGERIDFEGMGWMLRGLQPALRGQYQRENVATAIAGLASARDCLPVSESAIRAGLAGVCWPGRLDIISERPLTILDGAHNLDGIAALERELRRLLDGRRMHVLFAVMRDKNWAPMVDRLAPLCASAVVTEVFPPRGQPAAPVVERFSRWCPAQGEPDARRAWHFVRARARGDEVLLVAGSLFLVGAVLPLCREDASAQSAALLPSVQP